MAKLVAEIEQEITHDEHTLKGIEEELANLGPTADVFSLTREHQRLKEQLDGRLASWQEQSERLDKLNELQG